MWVRLWVRGKSEASTYRWLPDDSTDEDLRCEADDWSSHTSQGILNDHYRYGFDRLKKLPAAHRRVRRSS